MLPLAALGLPSAGTSGCRRIVTKFLAEVWWYPSRTDVSGVTRTGARGKTIGGAGRRPRFPVFRIQVLMAS